MLELSTATSNAFSAEGVLHEKMAVQNPKAIRLKNIDSFIIFFRQDRPATGASENEVCDRLFIVNDRTKAFIKKPEFSPAFY
jgi:hypothetical protein